VTDAIALFRRPFYFVRHGESELNAQRIIAGSIDTELTALGRRQSLEAADALANAPITAIYTSAMRRARDTAAPIAERLKLPVTVIPELGERHWGSFEGMPRDARTPGATPENAEAREDFVRRVLAGFARIDSPVPLIVGHSGVYRVLCHTLALVETEGPVDNCRPLRVSALPGGGWKVEPL
jgi:probable phosphoglycerate mutase